MGSAEALADLDDDVDAVEPLNEEDAVAQATKRRERRPWYKIVLGAMLAVEAMRRLDAAFEDRPDEDMVARKDKGHVLAATLVLDEFGNARCRQPDDCQLCLGARHARARRRGG